MVEFIKPKNLNGTELRQELQNAGINISDDRFSVSVIGETLILDIDAKDTKKASEIVAAHNGTIIPTELSVADKLASVGLNLDDLKTALGL